MRGKLIVGILALVVALILILAPACGKGGAEPTPTPGITPTPGVTPTPGQTPTPTPQAKTIKFGMLMPFSGAGAVWGAETENGVRLAIDKVNGRGGIRVGNDRYLIELVKCDDKLLGSAAAQCATRFVFDEKIHYVVGPIVTAQAINPITTDGKMFISLIANGWEGVIGPEWPYTIATAAPVPQWVETFWTQAYEFHPEIETVAIIADTSLAGQLYLPASQAAHAKFGREVIDVTRYEVFTQDYFPILTPVVAKNPDVIDFAGGNKGDIDLMVKQVRELGYTGLLAGGAHGDPQSTIDIAGAAAAEGFMVNDPDYSSDLYPESTHEIYREFQQRFPGQPVALTNYLGYGTVMLYVQAIEKAGSIDPDMVRTVLDDPTFRFEWFGNPGKSMGGLETFRILRQVQDEVGFSEVVNGKKVMRSRLAIVVP